MGPLAVIHHTGRLVVIDKPAGLLSVPGKGPQNQDCAAARVAAAFPGASGPLVVHRLDMETSGLLLFGLDPAAQRSLSMQFEARTIGKRYHALLADDPREAGNPAEGEISIPIRADITRRPLQVVDDVQGRHATTRYRILGPRTGGCLIEFEPVTGRSHQLRLHSASPRGLGTPIVGDRLYGGIPAPRLMLHASWLEFTDVDSGERTAVRSPAPFLG